MSKATKDVLAERQRQQDVEGWTPEHDDEHDDYSLGFAAVSYAMPNKAIGGQGTKPTLAPFTWPWDREWWKPKSYRENLVRAGALIIAEIERLDRAES